MTTPISSPKRSGLPPLDPTLTRARSSGAAPPPGTLKSGCLSFLTKPDDIDAPGSLSAKMGESYPATDFSKISSHADGNCFFTSVAQDNTDDISKDRNGFLLAAPGNRLRDQSASFVRENHNMISGFLKSSGCDMTAAQFGDMMSTSGSWDGDVGDLFPTIAAHVTGREVLVFEENDEGMYQLTSGAGSYCDELDPEGKKDNTQEGKPPILLKKKYITDPSSGRKSEHYDLLKPKDTSVSTRSSGPSGLDTGRPALRSTASVSRGVAHSAASVDIDKVVKKMPASSSKDMSKLSESNLAKALNKIAEDFITYTNATHYLTDSSSSKKLQSKCDIANALETKYGVEQKSSMTNAFQSIDAGASMVASMSDRLLKVTEEIEKRESTGKIGGDSRRQLAEVEHNLQGLLANPASAYSPPPTLAMSVKPYLPIIEKEFLNGKSLKTATISDLKDASNKIGIMFESYEKAVAAKDHAKNPLEKTQGKIKKNQIEKRLTATYQKTGKLFVQKPCLSVMAPVPSSIPSSTKMAHNREEAFKAMTLMSQRLKEEVTLREEQMASNGEELTAIDKEVISFTKGRLSLLLNTRLVESSVITAEAKERIIDATDVSEKPKVDKQPFADDRILMVGKPYEGYIEKNLLKGSTLVNAGGEELSSGIDNLGELLNAYCDAMKGIEGEDKKGKKFLDKKAKNGFIEDKRKLQNSLPQVGCYSQKHEGRQGAMAGVTIIYMRLAAEVNRLPDGPEKTQCTKSLNTIAEVIKEPGFTIDNSELVKGIHKLSLPSIGETKMQAMDDYVSSVSDSLGLLQTKSGPKKSWHSTAIDKKVTDAQAKLKSLSDKTSPTMTAAQLAESGIKANKILQKVYEDISRHADKLISSASKTTDPVGTTTAMTALRNAADLAAQHHQSSKEVGIVAKAIYEFKEDLPRHVNERIATAPASGVTASGTTTYSGGIGVGSDVGLATLKGKLSGTYSTRQSASTSRANDGNLFSSILITVTKSQSLSLEAGVGQYLNNDALKDGTLGASAVLKGTRTTSHVTGKIGLAGSPGAAFGTHQSAQLLQGKKAGTQVGLGSGVTGLSDTFASRSLREQPSGAKERIKDKFSIKNKNISATSLKRGYNNDARLDSAMKKLLGDSAVTAYGKKPEVTTADGKKTEKPEVTTADGKTAEQPKPPLAMLFSTAELQNGKESLKGVMSELFPDPLWESTEFEADRTQYSASLTAKFSATILEKFNTQVGASFGGNVAWGTTDVSRIVRSAKFPHQIFNKGLTLSEDRAVDYAKNFFYYPTAANRMILESLAESLGFDSTSNCFQAVHSALSEPETLKVPLDLHQILQASKIDPEKIKKDYSDFQKDVNVIDAFFHQTSASLRHDMLDEVNDAVKNLRAKYGVKEEALPNFTAESMGDISVNKATKYRENYEGYTDSYQKFQDVSVAILTNFSAIAGATKLIANKETPDIKENRETKAALTEYADGILSMIEQRTLPWNNKEMADRSTFVRQVEAKPYSHSTSTTWSIKTEATHNLLGGQLNASQFFEGGSILVDGTPAWATSDGAQKSLNNTKDGSSPSMAFTEGEELIPQTTTGGLTDKRVNITYSKTVDHIPDDNTDPGQTGVTETTSMVGQKARVPLLDIWEARGLGGKLRKTALQVLAQKAVVDTDEVKVKRQGYPLEKKADGFPKKPEDARLFTTYQARIHGEQRDVGFKLGTGNIEVPGVLLSGDLGVTRTQGKTDYELKEFNYGNDVGGIAIVGEKLFKDHGLKISNIEDIINDHKTSGSTEKLELFEKLDIDKRFVDALVGNSQYDHMSAIMSKFRNAGIVEVKQDDGSVKLEFPKVNFEEGDNYGAAIVPEALKDVALKDSKGDVLDLSNTGEKNNKTYGNRAGFLAYALTRYDDSFAQDAYKNYSNFEKGDRPNEFPNIKEINDLLAETIDDAEKHDSKYDSKAAPLKRLDQTRQQWLKHAKPEQRKDFYQNHPDGQAMFVSYLKVVAFSACLNDITFQNNSLKMVKDDARINVVDHMFEAPEPAPYLGTEETFMEYLNMKKDYDEMKKELASRAPPPADGADGGTSASRPLSIDAKAVNTSAPVTPAAAPPSPSGSARGASTGPKSKKGPRVQEAVDKLQEKPVPTPTSTSTRVLGAPGFVADKRRSFEPSVAEPKPKAKPKAKTSGPSTGGSRRRRSAPAQATSTQPKASSAPAKSPRPSEASLNRSFSSKSPQSPQAKKEENIPPTTSTDLTE